VFDHPRRYIISVVSVCLSVCQTITFESLDAGSSHLHIRYISMEYGSSSYIKVKVTAAKKSKIPITVTPQCKTLIAHNSGLIKDRAVTEVCMYHGVCGYDRSNDVTAIFFT